MDEQEISAVERLDAKLALRAMQRHDRLWRTAQGRMRWTEAVGFLPALGFVAIGLLELSRGKGFLEALAANKGLIFVVLGMSSLGSFLWSRTQRQLNALLELVRRLELERSQR